MNLSLTEKIPLLKTKKGIFQLVIFSVYVILVFTFAVNHEVWFDEAQAWIIARDLSPTEIIGQMRNEGHSALWHFILFPFAKLGLPVVTMNIISTAFTAFAAGLVMFKSPFNLPTKVCIIFSSGFMYFLSVISRSYCLAMPLLLLIALNFEKRKQKPIFFGILVGLLANVHIMFFGAVAVLGITLLWDFITELKIRKKFRSVTKQFIGLASAGLLVLALIAQIWGSIEACTSASGREFKFSLEKISSKLVNSLFNLRSITDESSVSILIFCVIILFLLVFLINAYKQTYNIVLGIAGFAGMLFINGYIWYFNPTRAILFLNYFIFMLWMVCSHKFTNKSKRERKVLEKKAKTVNLAASVLVSVLMVCTAPVGLYYGFTDLSMNFCYSKEAAQFVQDELPEDSVIIVSTTSGWSDICAYDTKSHYWSLYYNGYYNYAPQSNNMIDRSSNMVDTVNKYFPDNENIYIYTNEWGLDFKGYESTVQKDGYSMELVYESSETMNYDTYKYHMALYKYIPQ